MIEDGLFEFEEEDDDYKDGEPISDGIYSEIKKSEIGRASCRERV